MLIRTAAYLSQRTVDHCISQRTLSANSCCASFAMLGTPMKFTRNEEIYGGGEPVDHIYNVARGAVRTYRVLSDGRRQIAGFSIYLGTPSGSRWGPIMGARPRQSQILR